MILKGRSWISAPTTCPLLVSATCRGFPSYSLTLLCHSWTLWGFCLSSTLFSRRGLRAISCSKRARRSSRSMSSEREKEHELSTTTKAKHSLVAVIPPPPCNLYLHRLFSLRSNLFLREIVILYNPDTLGASQYSKMAGFPRLLSSVTFMLKELEHKHFCKLCTFDFFLLKVAASQDWENSNMDT